MFVVAIAELKGTIENAIRPLGEALATTPYELRLAFNAGFPAVVCVTADEARARAAMRAVAERGHLPVMCAAREVTPSSQMTELRDFRFEPGGLVARQGSSDVLAFSDITALLRATHRTTSESTERVKERQFRPVAAVVSGGLILTKTTSRTVTSTTASNEQVLYLFSRANPPWILRERSASYTGLGSRLSATSFENFNTTIEQLRSRCPGAAYDERLRTSRPMRGVADGVEATDIYAHLLAQYFALSGAA